MNASVGALSNSGSLSRCVIALVACFVVVTAPKPGEAQRIAGEGMRHRTKHSKEDSAGTATGADEQDDVNPGYAPRDGGLTRIGERADHLWHQFHGAAHRLIALLFAFRYGQLLLATVRDGCSRVVDTVLAVNAATRTVPLERLDFRGWLLGAAFWMFVVGTIAGHVVSASWSASVAITCVVADIAMGLGHGWEAFMHAWLRLQAHTGTESVAKQVATTAPTSPASVKRIHGIFASNATRLVLDPSEGDEGDTPAAHPADVMSNGAPTGSNESGV